MNLQWRRAVYHTEGFNPDDIVSCPVVPEHRMKRKTLPYHVPDCKARYGKGLLQCPFSQLHYFRSKEELNAHELGCPMKRQITNTMISPAPAYNRSDDDDMVPALLRQPYVSALSNLMKNTNIASSPVVDMAELSSVSDATRARIPVWNDLTNRVLLSNYRANPLLQNNEPGAKPSKAARLQAVEEENDNDLDESDKRNDVYQGRMGFLGMRLPCASDSGWDMVEESSDDEADYSPGSRFSEDTSQYRRATFGRPRLEDERDACARPTQFIPDLNAIPKPFRALMKKKLDRDLIIYKTGLNPRYDKSLDRPNVFRKRGPDPREFQELAAWYEDLIMKPTLRELDATDEKTAAA